MGRVSCTKGKLMLVLCVAAGRAFCSPAQNTYALAVIDCTPQSASFDNTLTYSCSASAACYYVAQGARQHRVHTMTPNTCCVEHCADSNVLLGMTKLITHMSGGHVCRKHDTNASEAPVACLKTQL